MKKKLVTLLLISAMALSLAACGTNTEKAGAGSESTASESSTAATTDAAVSSDQAYIEQTLNLANNEDQEWTYSADDDAWILSIVSAVAYPEIEEEQGVSVCVPGAYVKGIDSNGDGQADVTASDASGAVKGSLVIDYQAEVTSSNGQVYTAATAPVILNTGAAGYSSQSNSLAATTYAADGYINIACGNRGKQDTVSSDDGSSSYTGDAPSCLVDQKNAARFVKYNILLGNLPGSVDYFVSTGGSGGGAHAAMFAATSNHSDYYPYEVAAGAVGVYQTEDGGYSTTVTIEGTDYEISDGAWGCVAYSPITSLAEADMAQAFEYYLDTDYDYGSSFQAQLAQYLSEEYMNYINDQNLSVQEAAVGFDLNGDGDTKDTIDLFIEYDENKYADTNGYGGSYLDLYLAEFQSNLTWYLENLDYADDWTWFDADGNALSDQALAAMTAEEKAAAFLEGRYSKGQTDQKGGPGGMGGGMKGQLPSGMGGKDDFKGEKPDFENGQKPDFKNGEKPDFENGESSDFGNGQKPDFGNGEKPDFENGESSDFGNGQKPDSGNDEKAGTPDAGTTQAAGSSTDSNNYESFNDMLAAYEADIAEIEAGDQYGNNIVSLYDPLNYIGQEGTENPSWVRLMMGAAEGDMSMFSSLNLQLAFLNAGVDANIEWQWDGGHVPSEIFGESLSLYVDEMYGQYVDGAKQISKAAAQTQTENGDADAATGTDISSWASYEEGAASFSLADAVRYRAQGSSKAVPGFDVIDYGQEDYVFGDADSDARHWDSHLLKVLQDHADQLRDLFNQES